MPDILFKIKRQLKYSLGLNPKAKQLNDADIEPVVKEIAAFTGQPADQVWEKARREAAKAGTLVAEAWRAADPKTPVEVEAFYKTTDAYLYDLPIEHQRGLRAAWEQDLVKLLKTFNAKSVFDFGGGTGEDAMLLATSGFETTYYDLPGKTYDFAAWRFQQRKLAIPTISAIDPKLERQFDGLISIEVLEHVNDPIATVTQMHKLLKTGGRMILSESFTLLGDDYPSHIEGNQDLHQQFIPTVEKLGAKFIGFKGPDLRWYVFERTD